MSRSTQLATSSAESSSPYIPPELISLILATLWEGPHSSEEQSAVLKNIALVNRTWLTLVARITSRDAHIFNHRTANTFLRLLRAPSPIELKEPLDPFSTMEANLCADEMCRSITFHVDGSPSPGSLSKDTDRVPAIPSQWSSPAADAFNAISLVLDMVLGLNHVPNLRHISLRFTDWAYDEIFDLLEEGTFPRQVTHLSIDYSFTTPAVAPPFEFYMILRWAGMHFGRIPPLVPNVRHLSLSGVTTAFVAVMLQVCPNVETLEITNPAQLIALVPLNPAVRTLVLRHPGIALSRKTMTSWTLFSALDAGLFLSGTKPRIIVRSGTPEPVAFIGLRRSCKRFNADLVYERDDTRSRSC
ncbi:hypothetical protein LXA43DRAFT_1044566 [Ganoderma leucocontextum]|nr:hypothetical protein LXA43DRAFT_1044566 [Ganoderma leucocontextum]